MYVGVYEYVMRVWIHIHIYIYTLRERDRYVWHSIIIISLHKHTRLIYNQLISYFQRMVDWRPWNWGTPCNFVLHAILYYNKQSLLIHLSVYCFGQYDNTSPVHRTNGALRVQTYFVKTVETFLAFLYIGYERISGRFISFY